MNHPALPRASSPLRASIALSAALSAAATLLAPPALAEAPECLLPDPSKWPAPAKPYFMVAFDTSGSMSGAVASNNSCGYPNTRIGHGRCAIKNTVMAYSGQANFGLASYARKMTGCSAGCYTGCVFSNLPNNAGATNCNNGGCGAEPNAVANSSTRAGANILVPMLADTQPPAATNVPQLLSYVDNDCTNSVELFADGCTPLNGILRDMYRYYSSQWVYPGGGGPTYVSPLTSVAAGEHACRSVNVILVTDGDESCDNQADANTAAAALLAGFTKNGITWSVKTYVINFAGAGTANTDAIAAAGGTGASFFATNETQLSLALSNIIGGSIKPETCDNADNNCNGCTDEGFTHYCDVQPVAANCCSWATDPERKTCLGNYTSSITAANPQGNVALLPCTTSAQQQDPKLWLCYDPGEKCDNVDNNCSAGPDEGITKCGSPLHCPQPETCNGQDDDCNGLIDDGAGACSCLVSPQMEICDGCDNDCDGFTDNGVPSIPCGLTGPGEPPNCAGTLVCKASQPVSPGACTAGGGFKACNNAPQAEICDALDNNCNGIVDDGVPEMPCVPSNAPPNLNYGANSQCKMGHTVCANGTTTCVGWVGPGTEVCDGIDNNCNGTVDDNVTSGVGLPCGVNQPPCTPGTTACVNGALVCQGGVQPKPEVCNGLDDNCNGQVDEVPLADAPAAGMNGCWNQPGNCCTFNNLTWCPPSGASCTDNGTLTAPCNKGTLACAGVSGWVCQNPKGPNAETCDGIDNDCNGTIDDGNLPSPVGQVCGSNVGECKPGIIMCAAGVLDCVGDVPPSPETCDGKDNDCDGTTDNGILVGAPCWVPYDKTLYPDDPNDPTKERKALPCQPGVLQCNGMGGQICVGGVGPTPEVCDGVDNDCDGKVDELGSAPDGIDGSKNPLPPPDAKIGDACGGVQGGCKQGAYACVGGTFACLGETAGSPETCDCIDNDCNGVVDDPNGAGGPPLCGQGKACIKAANACLCAAPCSPQSEFPCPAGQVCQTVTSSQTGSPLGTYCVPNPCSDCMSATVKDANANVICAPKGTTLPGCITPPECVCRGQNGCDEPCAGVTCSAGTVCTNFGPNAGKCVVDNCWNLPCQGCSKACFMGACVDAPCKPETCPMGQACKPSADFKDHVCVPSCSMIDCPSGKACIDGACVDDCNPLCQAGQVCDKSKSPPVCVADLCAATPCANGACCDPVTGACGDCPCEDVLCPEGEQCMRGQCRTASMDTGGSSSGTMTTTAATGAGGGATASSSTGSEGNGSGGAKGYFGLATGGGGCSCEVGPRPSRLADPRWAIAAIAIALTSLRRRQRARASRRGEEVQR